MKSRMKLLVAAVVFVGIAGAVSFSISAQTGGGETPPPQSQPKPKAPEAAYKPGLGDFMAFAQPHHIKLWLAGNSGNWPLAAYESHELAETFADVVTYQGDWHKTPMASMANSMFAVPMVAVDQAIKDKNRAGFRVAYGNLTVSCNACHQALDHGFVVITVPSLSVFPDQKFEPTGK